MATVRRRMSLGLVLVIGCTRAPTGFQAPPMDGATVVDPISRASCAKAAEHSSAVYRGRTYYFCDESHLEAFAKTPERWADPLGAASAVAKPPDVRERNDAVRSDVRSSE